MLYNDHEEKKIENSILDDFSYIVATKIMPKRRRTEIIRQRDHQYKKFG